MSLIKLATAEAGSTASRRKSIGFVLLGTALTCVSAKIHVPLYPIPMTLQTMVVMGLGLAYGPRHAMASFALYLGLGALGLPVFADSPALGVGLAYMAGPTGGYLLGFLCACGLVGVLSQGRGPIGRVLAMLTGLALIYALGVVWLVHFVGSFDRAFLVGVLRLLPGDLIKIAIVLAAVSLNDLHLATRGSA